MTRLRPVLMTTAATVFGHMPLVFVTGAGAQARNSIGIMLVTGMSIGTENLVRKAILNGMDPQEAYLKYGKF